MNGLVKEVTFDMRYIKESKRGLILLCAAVLVLNFSWCGNTAFAAEPSREATTKELVEYYESGEYEKDIREVADEAIEYLKTFEGKEGKFAVVLDVDETAVSNWGELFPTRFHFSPSYWKKWLTEERAPPIKPTLTLFNQAKKQAVAVFFITGRKEKYRQVTVEDLERAGYSGCAGLTMRTPDTFSEPASVYKPRARKMIAEEGYDIILNMGDQESDLVGGYARKTFKLPNPFYEVK